MKSIFRYPGGKSKSHIREWILSHKPAECQEYREPFVGGGGIYFGLAPQGIQRRWINDKHSGLIAVYRALLNDPESFIETCREVPIANESDPLTEEGPRGGKPVNARLKAVFESVMLNEECDQAFRYYFVNRTVHGSGRVNYDIPSRLYFSNPEGWNVIATDLLEQAAKHIVGTKITCGDYSELLEDDGENVWIYCDPPYVVNTNLTASSQLYQHSFTLDDHRRFAELVANCKHKVCISYDDDDEGFIRSLYPENNFWIVEASWKYAGTTNEEKEDGKELLILNYEPSSGIVAPQVIGIAPPLTSRERDVLNECKAVVRKHLESWFEAGHALATVRDSGAPSRRLYRETHSTFEEYCRDELGMGKSQCYRLIHGAEIRDALKTSPIGDVLQTLSHFRDLEKLDSHEDVITVVGAVVESVDEPKEITAKLIKEHVDAHLGVEPKPPRDDYASAFKAVSRLTPEQQQKLFQEFLGNRLAQSA